MPYKIEVDGSKFKVVSKEGGKVHGTHSSRKDAMKQMRALYANVKDAKPAKAAEGAVVTSSDLISKGWKESQEEKE